jgi:hypothetical protein
MSALRLGDSDSPNRLISDNYFGGAVISNAQIAAGRMYMDAR